MADEKKNHYQARNEPELVLAHSYSSYVRPPDTIPLHWRQENSPAPAMDFDDVSPPPAFHHRPGKPPKLWEDWKYSFENYLATVDDDKFSGQRGRALLHCIGAEAQGIFKTILVTPKFEDETDYKHALHQLSGFYEPKVNVIAEWHTFCQRKQFPTEFAAEYVAVLCGITAICQCRAITDKLIYDRVVHCTPHRRLREGF